MVDYIAGTASLVSRVTHCFIWWTWNGIHTLSMPVDQSILLAIYSYPILKDLLKCNTKNSKSGVYMALEYHKVSSYYCMGEEGVCLGFSNGVSIWKRVQDEVIWGCSLQMLICWWRFRLSNAQSATQHHKYMVNWTDLYIVLDYDTIKHLYLLNNKDSSCLLQLS